MAYTTNPKLPRVRMEAVNLLRQGWSTRQIARYTGYDHSAIVRWSHKKPVYGKHNSLVIPTQSSKPNHHPRQLSDAIVTKILELRSERHQCAEILHHRLAQENIITSLSSVKRTLKRYGYSRFSRWKKWHQYTPRPLPKKPGLLLQLDSLIEGPSNFRLCAYALIDVCSRWAYAAPISRATSRTSVYFLRQARETAPFAFQCIQTDHGGEFSKWFTKIVEHHGVSHRHSRVRRPTDNGHVERFIRTLQDECLHRIPRDYSIWKKEIPEYLYYYNTERPHMGLAMKTPIQVVRSY